MKKHATEKDPWGLEYTKQNTAGSGAYRVVSWNAGTEVVLERNDKWTGGPLPKVKRVIWRMVPSAGNRRALLERGDADISYDLPNKDFVELKDIGQAQHRLDALFKRHPVYRHERHQAAVRQSEGAPGGRLRHSLPEDHGRGAVRPVEADVRRARRTPTEVAWPQPHKFNTDIAKAKQLLAEAGYPNGFETTLSFDLGFAGVNEPLCVLTQESLAQIGIKMHDQQDSGRDLAHRAEQEDVAALHQRVLGLARLSRILLHLVLSRQEFDLQHHELPVEGDGRLHRRRRRRAAAEGDKAGYDKDVKGFVDLAFADMPRIPLFQPYVNVAMQKNVTGYQYWFHRRLDYRALAKG